MIYDMPPVLQGSPQQQLNDLRNYLVRLARQQQMETSGAVTQNGTTVKKAGGKKLDDETMAKELEELRQRAQALKSLIIKTADETYQEAVGASESIMRQLFVARSDFGTVQEEIYTRIEETAQAIRESFNYEALAASVDNMEQYIHLIDGEIRRGFIEVNGVINFGIVISSRNVFAANEQTYTPAGETNVYYEIDTGDCFGLYTATGWQFWKGNMKLGWFDTSDGQLHVDNINIEANLIMGPWRLTNNGGAWGLKYVGA